MCFYCTFITVFLPHFGSVECLRCRAAGSIACCSVSAGAFVVSRLQKPPLLLFLFLFWRETGVSVCFHPILAFFSAGGSAACCSVSVAALAASPPPLLSAF